MSFLPPVSVRFAALLAFFSLVLQASSVSAEVIFTVGDIREMDPPDPMYGPVNVSEIFFEGSLDAPAAIPFSIVDVGRYDDMVPSCDNLRTLDAADAYFVFQHPNTFPIHNDAIMVFSAPIVGIITEDVCMAMSDDYFARSGISYGSGGLGLTSAEGDILQLMPGRRTLFHRLNALSDGDWDGYRVVTEVLRDDANGDVSLECTGLGREVMAGDTVDVTFRLMNNATIDVSSPQIIFRVPSTATITSRFDPPFSCTDEGAPVGIVQCVYPDVLPAGEGAELTITLQFDSAPTLVDRFLAFGSGAVHDPMLDNNRCEILVGPGAGDAGLPDGGFADGGSGDGGFGDGGRDGSIADDGGYRADGASASSDAGSAESGASFRGAGGCACRVGAAKAPSGAFTGIAMLLALTVERRRRRRRKSTEVDSCSG